MKVGRWSPDEIQTLARMRREGASDPAIAAALDRTVKSVECKWQYLNLSEEGREVRRQGMRKRRIAAGIQSKRVGKDDRIMKMDRPDPMSMQAREIRLSICPRDLTALICGDPLPGYSALDRRA
jgi:hypothetical protein